MTALRSARIDTPVGPLTLFVREGVLCALGFAESGDDRRRGLAARLRPLEAGIEDERPPGSVSGRLAAYFAGDLAALDAIPVDPGGTPFQQSVWTELRRVGAGQTVAYSELAARIGAPSAVRAVAAANARNPVAVVIPCHRVIGADGSLTGYGGGLERKRWLLEHEGARLPAQRGLSFR